MSTTTNTLKISITKSTQSTVLVPFWKATVATPQASWFALYQSHAKPSRKTVVDDFVDFRQGGKGKDNYSPWRPC